MRERIGVLGGSFNPIHPGHLLVAEEVKDRFGLERVIFVPASRPPHKSGGLAPFADRLAMVTSALRGWPGFAVSDIEGRRPGASYTVDTLRELRALGSLFLILGCDQYAEMSAWWEPETLTRLARLIVVSRPGVRRPALFPGHRPSRVSFHDTIDVDISAAMIRRRLRQDKSVRYLLTAPVREYITRHRLYN